MTKISSTFENSLKNVYGKTEKFIYEYKMADRP